MRPRVECSSTNQPGIASLIVMFAIRLSAHYGETITYCVTSRPFAQPYE